MGSDGPLRDHLDLLVLGVIKSGPTHGYDIIKEITRRSRGDFNLSEGGVYPALHRLEKAGDIESDWETVGGRQRRKYRITKKGSKGLADKRAEFERFATSVQSVVNSR